MCLQQDLMNKFMCWQPTPPVVDGRTKCDVTLSWKQETFGFLEEELLYTVERKEKIPPWVIVYSGSKTTKRIDNLAPCSPHKFRLRVILRSTAVPHLAEKALQFYGHENIVYEKMEGAHFKEGETVAQTNGRRNGGGDNGVGNDEVIQGNSKNIDDSGDKLHESLDNKERSQGFEVPGHRKWLESMWSEETCTSTDSDGTSATCFCMAVRGGYLKQVQIMLDERPALIGIINSTNGFTPLATAIRKGDINTVRFLLSAGAEVDQPSSTGQTPLHLAVLGGHAAIVELLLEKGADFQARDRNDLRAEHYAVDSCDLNMLKLILAKGDVGVRDNNGWTPLFRAIVQGARTEVIEELVQRGSDIDAVDAAGLQLTSAARLLKNRHGRTRDSILRLVDSQYPHEKAVSNFTRLTKKITSVHTLFK